MAVTLTTDTYHQNGGSGDLGVGPGDIIQYETGNHTVKGIVGYHGTAQNRIVIDLNGIDSDAGGSNSPVLGLSDCSYIDIIGSGATLHNTLTQGIMATNGCYGIRVFNVEVYDCGDTGIRIGFQTYNLSQARGNTSFGYDPISVVWGCIVHDTINEGIYQNASNCHTWYLSGNEYYAQNYGDLAICANNIVYNTGQDAIQVNGIINKALVYNNHVTNYATRNIGPHSTGIQVGVASKGYVFNNFIKDTGATSEGGGLALYGDDIRVYNNVVINPYVGIFFLDSITRANSKIELFNNTFTDISHVGISAAASERSYVKYYNNIFHATTSFSSQIDSDVGLTPDEQYNSFVEGAPGLTSLEFTDYANDDLTLLPGSVAAGTGINLRHYDSRLMVKKNGVLRPISGAWDRGAL